MTYIIVFVYLKEMFALILGKQNENIVQKKKCIS